MDHPIDLTQFSESELIDLNHKIIDRLRFLQEFKAHLAMSELYVGQEVDFLTPDGEIVTGMIMRLNKKTVTIVDVHGHRWRVAPDLIMDAESPADLELETDPVTETTSRGLSVTNSGRPKLVLLKNPIEGSPESL